MPAPTHDDGVMAGFPPSPHQRVTADRVYSAPRITAWFMRHVREVERTARVAPSPYASPPLPRDHRDIDDVVVRDAAGGRWTFAEMLAVTQTDGIMVLRGGTVLYERCFGGLELSTPHLCHSISKSVGACVAADLIDQGVLDARAPITRYVPELAGSAYGDALVRHLLDMSVGIRYTEDHEDEETEDAHLDRVCGVRPSRSRDEPGSAYDFATTMVKEGAHGGLFHYVSLNTTVLGWVMERASGTPVPELISCEVWSHLGAEDDAYIALDGAGSAQLDGGFCASLRDLARFATMLGDRGEAGGRRVVPAWWMDEVAGGGDAAAFAASPDRGLLPSGSSYKDCFWVVRPGPRPCFLGLGMYGQMVFVDQGRDLVAVKYSSQVRASDELLLAHTYRALDSLAESLA